MDDGLISNERGIVQQITRGEIVRAIKNHVIVGYNASHIGFV